MATQTVPDLIFGPPPAAPAAPPRQPQAPLTAVPDLIFDAPPTPSGSVTLHERLQGLASSRQVGGVSFRVTSTTGDTHARNSAHYRGLAIDTVPINAQGLGSRPGTHPPLNDPVWDATIKALQAAGYRVKDERIRKSKEWTAPHLHVEVRQFGTVADVAKRTEVLLREPLTTEMIDVPIGKTVIPVPKALLTTLEFVGTGSRAVEAALTDGRGYREVFRQHGFPDTGSFGPAAVAAGIMAGILDPVNLLTLGGAGALTAGGRKAIAEARHIRALQSGKLIRPRPEGKMAAEIAALEARALAETAIAHRESVPRVPPVVEKPVVLTKPAPATPKTKVAPVSAAPVRERILTPAEKTAAAAQTEEEVTQRVSQVRARGGVITPEPRAVPDLIFPGPKKPSGKVEAVTSLPRRPSTVQRVGALELEGRAEDVVTARPVARAAAPEPTLHISPELRRAPAAAPEAAFVKPTVEVHPPTRAALRFKQGDTVLFAQDGDTYRVERIGPRGYGLVDMQTGRKRPNVMHDELAQQPDLLRRVDKTTGQLIPAKRAVLRFHQGDTVLHARTGDTFRVERVGPRGYGLVDVQTGRRRINVMHDELATQPDLLMPVDKKTGQLIETKPVSPELKLMGEEAADQPVEIGKQQGLEASAQLKAARKPGVSKKAIEEQTLGQAIRGQGGISIEQSPDLIGELESVMRQKRFPPGVIVRRKGARTHAADDLAASLNAQGFRHPDGRELEGADLPRLLEDEFMGRQPKSRFLHPASSSRFEEAAIRQAEHRHALTSEGLMTSNVEQHFNAPDREQAGVLKALGRAMRELGEPDTSAARKKVAGRATQIYNTELLPGMGARTAGPRSQKFFDDVLAADLSESGLPVSTSAAKRVVTDPDGPLSKRIEIADEHAEALADDLRIDSQAATPQQRVKQKLWQQLKDESGRAPVIGEMIAPTVQALRLVTAVKKGLVQQADSVVRKMGAEGEELARRMQAVHRDHRLDVGNDLAQIRRFEFLSDASWDKVRAAAQDEPVQLTPQERALLPVAQRILAKVREDALAENIDVGFREHYWPIRLNERALQGRTSEAVHDIMARTGADEERALQILERWQADAQKGRPFGNLERSRESWAPDWVRKPAKQEFLEYVYYGRRRVVQVRYFGLNNEQFNTRLRVIRIRDPQDGTFAAEWFDAEMGLRPREAFLEDVVRTVSDTVAAKSMVLSVISNSTQPINNLFITDVGTFARGWGRLVNEVTREDAAEFSVRVGGALDQSMREMIGQIAGREGGLTQKVTTRTGFLGREGANRVITANVSREWTRDLAEALVRTDARRPSWLRGHRMATIERQLRRIDLDPDAIRAHVAELRGEGRDINGLLDEWHRRMRRGDPDTVRAALREHPLLTDRQERTAALKLVDLTQFPMNPGSLPLLWNSPWMRLATMFKRFPYKQGQLVFQSVITEGRHGNLKPLVVLLAAFPIIGAGVRDVRTLLLHPIQSFTEPEKAFRGGRPAILNPWRDMILNLAYVGGVGLASDLVRALSARQVGEAAASFLGGPSFTEAVDLLKIVSDLDQPGKAGKRTLRKAIDLLLTPGLAGAFGLPGAILGQTLERSGIFSTTTPSRGRRRRSRQRRRSSLFSGA